MNRLLKAVPLLGQFFDSLCFERRQGQKAKAHLDISKPFNKVVPGPSEVYSLPKLVDQTLKFGAIDSDTAIFLSNCLDLSPDVRTTF